MPKIVQRTLFQSYSTICVFHGRDGHCSIHVEVRYNGDFIKWKHLLHYWSSARKIHQSPVDSFHKMSLMQTFGVSLMFAKINCSTNTTANNDLRGHDYHVGWDHYNDVTISATASQVTGVSIACSIVGSGANQRKHQCSTSLAFVRIIPRWPANSPHKRAVTRKNVSIWWRRHDGINCEFEKRIYILHLELLCYIQYRFILTIKHRVLTARQLISRSGGNAHKKYITFFTEMS